MAAQIQKENGSVAKSLQMQKFRILKLNMENRDIPLDLRSRLMKLHAKLSRAIATGATATAGSAAIGGTPSVSQDSRVAQILAEAGATAAAASGQPTAAATMPAAQTPAVAASAATAPVAATPQAAARPVVQAPVAQAPVQQPAYQAPAPMPMPMPAPAPVEEESNMQLYIMGGMGIWSKLTFCINYEYLWSTSKWKRCSGNHAKCAQGNYLFVCNYSSALGPHSYTS